MRTVIEPGREIPIINEVDIAVVGGGCTGVFAAIRSARLGARVAIIEATGSFGGVATNGFVCVWHTLCDTTLNRQIIGGLTEETIERLKCIPHGIRINLPKDEEKHVFRKSTYANYHLNTEELKIELDTMLTEAGVIPYLHTKYSAPYIDNGELCGVIVEQRSGRGVILAKQFIDASADGFLGADMGMEVYRHETLQPATSAARVYGWDKLTDPLNILKNNREYIGCRPGWQDGLADIPNVMNWFKSNVMEDCSVGDALTRAEMTGRAQIRRMLEVLRSQDSGADELALIGLSSAIGIRETRQLTCSYQFTADDLCYGRKFDDAVVYCAYPMDIHHPLKNTAYRYLDGTEEIVEIGKENRLVRWRNDTDVYPTYWQMPYRSMLPKDIPNLLICGRAIDADKGAFAAARVMISLNQTGEAAGVAAVEALTSDRTVQNIDIASMRRKMKQGGSIILEN